LNTGVARISEIQSSLVDRLSIKPPLTQSIAHPDAAKFGNLAASMQVCKSHLDNFKESMLSICKANSLLPNRLLPEPLVARSTAQANILKSDGSATACRAYKSDLDVVIARSTAQANILKSDGSATAAHSSLIDRLSIKPILARLTAQANVAKISSLMPENLACKSSLDTFVKGIDRANQINPLLNMERSCSDRSGLFSQIKLLESMQSANTLESYLSRKN
jgi:hypothetical protein